MNNRIRIILIISCLLSIFLSIYCFLYAFSTACENHYNVKKGTLLWKMVMFDETITNFPIIYPQGEPTYNHIGGDSPNIGAGWELEYSSFQDLHKIQSAISVYLAKEGYILQEVKFPECSWKRYNAREDTLLFSAGKGEKCLDLSFIKVEKHTKIEVIILE